MAKYTANYRGVGELLNADFIEAALRVPAERVRDRAVGIAPYDEHSVTHFKDSFHVESGTHGGDHADRAYARVVNDDDAAIQIEFGTKRTPKHRTLGIALEAAKD